MFLILLVFACGFIAGKIHSRKRKGKDLINKGIGYNPSPKGPVVRPPVTPWIPKNPFPSPSIHKGSYIPPKPPVNPIPPHEREE